MVKNREELIKVAENGANQLKTNLRSAIVAFMDVQNVSPEELAYVLGISFDDIIQIIEGDGNITVDTLSKLLVATNLAVEIKPVRNTPIGEYNGNKPLHCGQMPNPNRFNGMHQPKHFGGTIGPKPEELNDKKPLRDSRGRFAKKETQTEPQPTFKNEQVVQRPTMNDNPYFKMGPRELADIICKNIWDGEIDVENATREEMAEFLTDKERIMRERTTNGNVVREHKPKSSNSSDELGRFFGMLNEMAKEAENNPNLRNAISKFMNR